MNNFRKAVSRFIGRPRAAATAVLISAFCAAQTDAATKTVEAIPGEGPIRVLFLGNNPDQGRDSDKVFPTLTRGISRDAIYFDYLRSLEGGLGDWNYLNQFDAILWYNDHIEFSDTEFENLKRFIESGKGLVALHLTESLPEMVPLLGREVERVGDPKEVAIATVESDHRVMSEDAIGESMNTGKPTILQSLAGEPWTWTHSLKDGRVLYTESGYDPKEWKDPEFLQLLKRGILWSVGDDRVTSYRSFLASRKPLRYEPRTDIPNFEGIPGGFEFQFPMPAEDSLDYFQVPVGFELTLFASEPDIMNPIYMDWDERGRLWVVQSVDYPHYMKEDQIGNDTIKILEDTDGDGRCDKITIFADKLNLPTSFTFSNGGIIVAQAPNFLFLKDLDGDDRADVKQTLMTGWGTMDTHAGPSHLQYALDNKMWGSVGYSGYVGSGNQDEGFSNGVYRFNTDGSGLEFLYQGSNNTWGLGFNDAGDGFFGGANGAPSFFGYLPETVMVGEGKSATMIARNKFLASITSNVRQTNNFGQFSGATGQFFASSGRFPEAWRNETLFIGGTTGHVVNRYTLIPEEGGYRGQNEFSMLASADEWVSPTCVRVGPDGALWILDWYNYILQHNPIATPEVGGYTAVKGTGNAHINPNRDNTRGRIYRMSWKGEYEPKTTNLAGASDEELVQALDDDNQFWRMTAQRILVQEKRWGATAALKARLGQTGVGAIHALWTLKGFGKLSEEEHRAALASNDPKLRRNAVRAISEDASGASILIGKSEALLAETDLLTLREIYNKFAAFPASEELRATLEPLRDHKVEGVELAYAFENLRKKHKLVDSKARDESVYLENGDAGKGKTIAFEHPYVNCFICHKVTVDGTLVGSEMGPILDGIATRKEPAYILESLLRPNAAIAQGYGHFDGGSPMPPLGSVLSEQEIADLMAYLLTLK